jgi:hypothetical protein
VKPTESAGKQDRHDQDTCAEHEQATLREEGLAARAKGHFGACEHGLDEAQKIDPAGENDVRVREGRASIRKAKTPLPFDDDPPKLSPH